MLYMCVFFQDIAFFIGYTTVNGIRVQGSPMRYADGKVKVTLFPGGKAVSNLTPFITLNLSQLVAPNKTWASRNYHFCDLFVQGPSIFNIQSHLAMLICQVTTTHFCFQWSYRRCISSSDQALPVKTRAFKQSKLNLLKPQSKLKFDKSDTRIL